MGQLRYSPERVGRDDPNFGRTNLLHRFPLTRGEERITLWGAVTDTGAGNAMSPALRELSGTHDLLLLAREAGEDALNAAGLDLITVRGLNPTLRLEGMKGDVVFTGMASNPTLELLMHLAAMNKGIKTAAIEDYPGAYGAEFRGYFMKGLGIKPDYLLVMNQWAKDENLRQVPIFKPDNVIVTGQPAFDGIAVENRKQIKSNVYSQIGMSGGELVVWMGQKRGTPEAFELFIDGLLAANPQDFRLVIRRHPRDEVSIDKYEDMAGPFKSRLISTLGIPTSQVGAAADKVVTIFSTEGLFSVMRGIPTVHIMPREILDLTEVPDVVVPVVEDGSSLVIRDPGESRMVIAKLFDVDAVVELKEKMAAWKPDGNAAKRVADALVRIARGQL